MRVLQYPEVGVVAKLLTETSGQFRQHVTLARDSVYLNLKRLHPNILWNREYAKTTHSTTTTSASRVHSHVYDAVMIAPVPAPPG